MKKLLFLIGLAAWLAVACSAVVNAYDNRQTTINALESKQKAKAAQYTTTLQKQLKQADTSLSADSTAKTELCSFATQMQTDLAKYKVTVSIPPVCTGSPS